MSFSPFISTKYMSRLFRIATAIFVILIFLLVAVLMDNQEKLEQRIANQDILIERIISLLEPELKMTINRTP